MNNNNNQDKQPPDRPRWKFSQALKINLKEVNQFVSHYEVIKSIKQSMSETDFNEIVSIYPFNSSKIWILTVRELTTYLRLLGKNIEMFGNELKMVDANSFDSINGRKTLVFRFHYLPDDIYSHYFDSYFKETKLDIKVESVLKECYKEFPGIQNGTIRIKVSFEDKIEDKVRNLTGYSKVNGLKTLITIAGEKNKCFFCNNKEHAIKDCPLKSLKCTKCNNRGHTSDKCSLANRLQALERNKVDYNDYELVETEPQASEAEKCTQELQKQTNLNSGQNSNEAMQKNDHDMEETNQIINDNDNISDTNTNEQNNANAQLNDSLNLIGEDILSKSGFKLAENGEISNSPNINAAKAKPISNSELLNNILQQKTNDPSFAAPTPVQTTTMNNSRGNNSNRSNNQRVRNNSNTRSRPIDLGNYKEQNTSSNKRALDSSSSPTESTTTTTNTSRPKKSNTVKNLLNNESSDQKRNAKKNNSQNSNQISTNLKSKPHLPYI
jgi:hypothetical protein